MRNRERIPDVENVDLVPESHSPAGAPGFDAQHFLALSLGFLILILLTYLVFG